MATKNYGFPTITENMTADIVRDQNALAVAVDEKLKEVEEKATNIDLSSLQTQIDKKADKEELIAHLGETMPHIFKDGAKKYKYGLKTNTAKDGLIFVYEEVL